MKVNLKIIGYFLIALWIIFSVVYIINDIWQDFKTQQLKKAYEQGKIDTINLLIKEAEKCQPVPIFSGEKEIRVIKIGCQINQ